MSQSLYALYASALRLGRRYGYRGRALYCPFCKKSFRKMISGGSKEKVWVTDDIHPGGWREHLYCPNCYSTDKERLALLLFRKKGILADADSGKSILHIAPERHLGVLLKNQNAQYVSGDLTPGRAMEVVDLTQMTFPDASFDVCICSQVMEHISDDRAAMSEIFRVLKPGGWAFVPTPISFARKETYENPFVVDPQERERVFGQSDHVRIYAMDYLDRLSAVGFQVEAIQPQDLSMEWQKYAINPRELAIVATKPNNPDTI